VGVLFIFPAPDKLAMRPTQEQQVKSQPLGAILDGLREAFQLGPLAMFLCSY